MLLGHARGKVGDIVFSRSNGEQVVRARAAVVKNPRSDAQMVQRVIMLTAVNAYSFAREIADHSIEGLGKGQQTMSAFVSAAVKKLRERITSNYEGATAFTPVGSRYFAINSYQISKGSLPKVAVVVDGTGVAKFYAGGNTYGDIISRYGLKRGDQLTFISIHEDADGNQLFAYSRIILDPRDANGDELPLTTAFAQNNAAVSANARNQGTFAKLAFATDGFEFSVGDADTLQAAAVIVSRQASNGNWLRSTAHLVVRMGATYKYTMGECIATGNGISIASDMYLNNAIRGGETVSAPAGGGNAGGGSSSGGGSDDSGDDLPPAGEGGQG